MEKFLKSHQETFMKGYFVTILLTEQGLYLFCGMAPKIL